MGPSFLRFSPTWRRRPMLTVADNFWFGSYWANYEASSSRPNKWMLVRAPPLAWSSRYASLDSGHRLGYGNLSACSRVNHLAGLCG